MMPQDDWARAYLDQASDDLAAANAVAGHSVAPSTLCMLLQMVFEKVTKAALLESGLWDIDKAKRTHQTIKSKAGTVLLEQLRRQSKLLGLHHDWDRLRLKLEELEDRHPQLFSERRKPDQRGPQFAAHGQLEYPWERNDGQVCSPAKDLSIAKELGDPKSTWGARLLNLATNLIQKFDTIF